MSTDNDDQGQGDGQGQDGQGGGGLEARVDGIEREQKEQRGVLDQILQHVSGGGSGGQGGGGQGGGGQGEGPPTYADFAGEVQRQISEADQRRAREEGEKQQASWRDGVTADLEKLKAENAPREPTGGLRGKLQRAFIGHDE